MTLCENQRRAQDPIQPSGHSVAGARLSSARAISRAELDQPTARAENRNLQLQEKFSNIKGLGVERNLQHSLPQKISTVPQLSVLY
jgi:hypothetical protein